VVQEKGKKREGRKVTKLVKRKRKETFLRKIKGVIEHAFSKGGKKGEKRQPHMNYDHTCRETFSLGES